MTSRPPSAPPPLAPPPGHQVGPNDPPRSTPPPLPTNAHSLRSRAHIPLLRCTGVCPIAAPDQTSPVKAFLSKISVWKGILLGSCFSPTPRWLRQVLQGASCKVDVYLWAERGNCSGGRLRHPRGARLCAGHRCGHRWPRLRFGPLNLSAWAAAGREGCPVVSRPASPPSSR
ncbi:unnamed protein product [Rangifer tarandus platyrhynchus]|uniref:Uncharacterized protein n=1 Tax=Rangifer tarandus platyrhynchus TaxID=3082113 RepID=A0AC59ZY55_RANTA